jgi:hypothetical protein
MGFDSGRTDMLAQITFFIWFIRLIHIASYNKASGDFEGTTFFHLEINDDHLYRDPEYSWDQYIHA